ncbi:MAG: (Fe-S)-binding protein [Fimbriimonadales bacterium]
MKVRLLLTCLCDAFYGEVGIATVRVLEHAGCEVTFPDSQTCCGQPPFNNGDWKTAKAVAERCKSVFQGDAPIITPSSSCAAMLRDGYKNLFPKDAAMPVFELSEFLLKQIGIEHWPLHGNANGKPITVAFHRACHGRALGLDDTQERALSLLQNVSLIPISDPEQCCGFGGSFSITQPNLSAEIGAEKLRRIGEAKPDLLVSGDMGCLMHLKSLMNKCAINLQTKHYAQLLSEAIP